MLRSARANIRRRISSANSEWCEGSAQASGRTEHSNASTRAAAIVDWREALRIRRSVLPTDHRDLARSLTTLGTMLANAEDREAAVALLEEAVQCHLRAEPPRPQELADVRARLVALYTRMGRPADAARHATPTPARKD